MRDLTMLSADKLLSIREPELLYSFSPLAAKREYRLLAGRWHPDRETSALAQSVFSHVVQLHNLAQEKRDAGAWNEPVDKVESERAGLKRYRKRDGSLKEVVYTARRYFELGAMYIGQAHVAFEIDKEHEDLFANCCSVMLALRFHDLDMAAEMAPRLPQFLDSFRTDAAAVLVLKKSPDQLLLADVLRHLNGKLADIRHLGWILNSLYNIACYLEWSEMAHNAIAPDTVFISPLRHSATLLGGWCYAAQFGAPMVALPDRTLAFAPEECVRCGEADARIDLELVRALGRELLGDASGSSLRGRADLPANLVDWLCLPAGEHAVSEYAEFKHDVLPEVFGAPSFINWRLESRDLYKEN